MVSKVISYTITLFIAIVGYRILSIHFLDNYFSWSITLTMLLLPIFSYLLQQSIERNIEKKIHHLLLLLYSMIMIWVVAILIALFSIIAAYLNFSWFFSNENYQSTLDIPAYKMIYNHLYWYTIFGFPSTLFSGIILYIKAKFKGTKN